MPALRMLGLVILAGFAVSIGILGYAYMRAALDESAAREAASKVKNACETVINIGGQQTVEINLPGNYHMRFLDNRVTLIVDNYRVFEGELMRRFAEDAPKLGPGAHKLSITIENNRLVVTEWT